MSLPLRASLLGLLLAFPLSSCKPEGCLAGDESAACSVPSPCQKLSFACSATEVGSVEARVLKAGDAVPQGLDSLGAVGDVLLGNDKIVAVIERLGNPNFLGPTGGNILDLSNRGRDDDGVNQILEVVGILPGDAVKWKSLEIVATGPEVAAVQVRGTLDGRPGVKVATRYEIRKCEPGIRVRTEIVNLTREPELWALGDGYYWSGREALAFTPGVNEGFRHDDFNLLTINSVYKQAPFLAWSSHAPPYASYATVGCNSALMEGFHSTQVSAAGLPRTIIPPREYQVFERFIAVTPRKDVAGAADVVMEARRQLYGEKFVTVSGKITRPGGVPVDGSEHQGAVVISELPTADAPVEKRIPWTQVVPGADGSFSARVPASKRYSLQVHAFGRVVSELKLETAGEDKDVGTLEVPLVAKVDLSVSDFLGLPIDARVVFAPADEATAAATSGTLFGSFAKCTPFLGPQHGPSPACNQVLVRGHTTLEVPAGHFHVYATAGMFHTLAHKEITLTTDPASLTFTVEPLPLLPKDALSADLHVHGRASFDSSIPDLDRALAFSAASMDVIAATDHDVIGNYAFAMTKLNLGKKIAVMNGLETTGHIPWFVNPGSVVPRVVGHYNFWPMIYDETRPRRGAPNDERIEPGLLFTTVAQVFDGAGVIELNHPWAPAEFGRDLGYPRALGMKLNRPLPKRDDGSADARFIRTPLGARYANNAHHAQEVMNGTENGTHLEYRAVWFAFLNQGLVYTGTANSDSHGLTDNVLGTPRNVVTAETRPAKFDAVAFNNAIRAGKSFGTNGPVIEATLTSGADTFTPGVAPISPAADATLSIKVKAAPWVPVREVRVIVNGEIAATFKDRSSPADPFGKAGLVRLEETVKLSEILPAGNADAWIVIEAGEPLPTAADLDDDGVPDTGDNNGDGVVDKKDVKEGETTGPLELPAIPANDTDPRFHFSVVTAHGLPQSFTNPFILDRDGGGFAGPGLKGGK